MLQWQSYCYIYIYVCIYTHTYIDVSNQHIVHLKLTQHHVNYLSINLEKNWMLKKRKKEN